MPACNVRASREEAVRYYWSDINTELYIQICMTLYAYRDALGEAFEV